MTTFMNIGTVGQQLEDALSGERLSILKKMPDLQSGCDELLNNAMIQLAKVSCKVLVRDEKIRVLMNEASRNATSMAQLVDALYHWKDDTYGCYDMLYVLFSTGLQHIERDDMVNWIQRLDNIFEFLTHEEYVPREDDHKRDVHMLVFYLNAYAKILASDQDEQDKLDMCQQLANPDCRAVLNIVASIYYANPRLCGGYTDFTAVAGSLISRAREHYVAYFLTAEKYARHERNCKFQWHSKRRYYYNDMVGWWQNKSQDTSMVGLLSIIWPNVDWKPSHNQFHLKRDKRPGTETGIPVCIKDYIDSHHKNIIADMDTRQQVLKLQVGNDKAEIQNEMNAVKNRLAEEVMMNRKEHMQLAAQMGGITNNYFGNIAQQVSNASQVTADCKN